MTRTLAETIKQQIPYTLQATNFETLGKKLKGKVRDVYLKNDKMFFITTDRQSAFDRHIASIPFKGQVLTEVSNYWFKETQHIIPNHLLEQEQVDPNVLVCKNLTIFPIEFVVRGFLTGVTSTSVWTAYEKGERDFCGNKLPEGMKKNEPFAEPIITPTTKDDIHDEKITPQEILEQKIMSEKEWEFCKEKVLAIFRFGQELVAKNGLILVDTKYELGKDEDGNIYLTDEIHTPDSSRYWLKDSYQERIANGQEPENIDKEFLRLWFKENTDPYNDKELPPPPEDLIIELAKRYILLYEKITNKKFEAKVGNIQDRIKENLIKNNYL